MVGRVTIVKFVMSTIPFYYIQCILVKKNYMQCIKPKKVWLDNKNFVLSTTIQRKKKKSSCQLGEYHKALAFERLNCKTKSRLAV